MYKVSYIHERESICSVPNFCSLSSSWSCHDIWDWDDMTKREEDKLCTVLVWILHERRKSIWVSLLYLPWFQSYSFKTFSSSEEVSMLCFGLAYMHIYIYTMYVCMNVLVCVWERYILHIYNKSRYDFQLRRAPHILFNTRNSNRQFGKLKIWKKKN